MKETFLFAFRAVMPMLIVMALGYFVRRVGPWDKEFYRQVNKLCFRLFLPVFLFSSVYNIESLGALNWNVILFLVIAVICGAFVTMIPARWLVPRRDQRCVIVQAGFRSNQAVIGLPLSDAIGGAAAVVFSALATGIIVPLFNILGVIVLSIYNGKEGERLSLRRVLRSIITNPLVIGCLGGVLVVLIRNLLPTGADGQPVFLISRDLPNLYSAMTSVSKIASPLMLFCLGAVLDFSAMRSLLRELILGVTLRLVACPLITITAAILLRRVLNLTATEFPAIISICATPVSIASEVMVQEMGGDDQLACQLVVWSSALSMFTIFVIVWLLRAMGYV